MDAINAEYQYSAIANTLINSLGLQQPPIAICFSQEAPVGIDAHAGRVPAGCRFWEDAASDRFVTTAANHSHCAIGVYTHNLRPSDSQQKDLVDALSVFRDLGYVREEDLPLIPVLGAHPEFVVYAPLAETPLLPDVVILFVKANQTLILSEATQQVESRTPPAMGRPACAVVPQVVNTGHAAFSLGCCGARAYLDGLTDDIAIFAIPGAKLKAYTERIDALSKANRLLAKFHGIRRRDIESGESPTIAQSLEALKASDN